MIHVTLAQCIKATKNGVFKTEDLNLTEPLSLEDMVFITEYLRITPVTGIDFSFILNKENSYGLEKLGELIAQKPQITTIVFKVTKFEFDYEYKNNPDLRIFGFIDDYRIGKINNRVFNALIELLENKPHLSDLKVDLELLETPANKSQAKKFAHNVAQSPLQSLDMKMAVEQESKLPILNSQQNTILRHVFIGNCLYGADALMYLKNTTLLTSLVIEDVLFSREDLDNLNTTLHANPALKVFRLGKTNLGQIDQITFFDHLKLCPSIEALGLSDNNLSRHNVDVACAYFSEAQIKELDISRNAYTSTEMIKIAAALERNRTIERLVIDDVLAEDTGLQAVFKLLQINPRIKSISTAKNCRYHPSDETIFKLCDLLSDPKCHLEEFSFNENLTIHQFKILCRAILANKSLHHVNLNYKDFGILGMIFEYKIDVHLGKVASDVSDDTTEKFIKIAEEITTDNRSQVDSFIDDSDLRFFPDSNGSDLDQSEGLEKSLLSI